MYCYFLEELSIFIVVKFLYNLSKVIYFYNKWDSLDFFKNEGI